LLLTPVGLHTVLVCKDFLDRHESVATLLQSVPVDWVWVPSYGDEKTLKEHLDKASDVARKTVGANVGVAQTENTAVAKLANQGKPTPLPGFGWRSATNSQEAVTVGGMVVIYPLKPT
jgi:hypothetical protein